LVKSKKMSENYQQRFFVPIHRSDRSQRRRVIQLAAVAGALAWPKRKEIVPESCSKRYVLMKGAANKESRKGGRFKLYI
jgi:hypothetical protein